MKFFLCPFERELAHPVSGVSVMCLLSLGPSSPRIGAYRDTEPAVRLTLDKATLSLQGSAPVVPYQFFHRFISRPRIPGDGSGRTVLHAQFAFAALRVNDRSVGFEGCIGEDARPGE